MYVESGGKKGRCARRVGFMCSPRTEGGTGVFRQTSLLSTVISSSSFHLYEFWTHHKMATSLMHILTPLSACMHRQVWSKNAQKEDLCHVTRICPRIFITPGGFHVADAPCCPCSRLNIPLEGWRRSVLASVRDANWIESKWTARISEPVHEHGHLL